MEKVEKNVKKEEDFEAQSMLDTLIRAEEIKSDPEKMERVRKIMQPKQKAHEAIKSMFDGGQEKPKSVSDIKKIKNKKAMEESEDE